MMNMIGAFPGIVMASHPRQVQRCSPMSPAQKYNSIPSKKPLTILNISHVTK